MNKLLLASLLTMTCLTAARADEVAPPSAPPANWLDGRGVLTVEQAQTALGISATPEQRVQLEKALADRNAAVAAANACLSGQLKTIFQADDAKLAEKVVQKDAEDVEGARLDRIRRHQPSRYQDIMRQKKAAEAKQ